MRIQNEDERRFYEMEAIEQQWSYEQLKCQYGSSLYERLALSRDKEDVLRLSREGRTLGSVVSAWLSLQRCILI
jgi:predicted nuclease of restriction endonuclease-like (RecB) superfamily